MEVSDLYDSNGNRTGRTANRGEKLGEDDYVMAAAAIVKVGEHYLITRRQEGKTNAGKWEFAGGGSRAGEEPLDALRRELKEETGIEAKPEQITFVKRVFYAPYHLFLYVFLVETDITLKDLVLQREEIAQAMFVTLAELKRMQSSFTPMDRQIYEEVDWLKE